MKKRALSLFLAVIMLCGCVCLALPSFELTAEAAAATGSAKVNASGSADRWIKQDTYWDTKAPIDEVPLTFEAVIRHKNVNPKKGVWLGNYVAGKTPSISFYVTVYGRPEVRIIDATGKNKTYNFGDQSKKTYTEDGTTVTLKQCLPFADSTYLHVAFTIDPQNDIIKYYQNGVLYGVVESDITDDLSACIQRPMRIGGDYRTGNTEFWTGAMHYVAIYNKPFTTAEIKARYEAGTWLDCDSLIAAWDLSKQGENACRDRSGNGHTLVYHGGEGIRFDTFGSYLIDEPLTGTPDTLEVWLWLPACYNTRAGTFIGNYGSGKSENFAYEIQNNGTPRFWVSNGNGTSFTYHFTNIDVRRSEWVHVAFVHDYDPANTEPVVIEDVFTAKSSEKIATPVYEVGQVVSSNTTTEENSYYTTKTVTTKTVSAVTGPSSGKYTVEYTTVKEVTKDVIIIEKIRK